jgi:hydrogenase small subunit
MANQSLIALEDDGRIDMAAARLSMTRREFLQFCAALATTLGLPQGADAAVAEAVATKPRPSVIWLHFQECTGCSESMLRAEHPTLEKLILDVISLDYHEALCSGAGHQAEAYKAKSMKENWGKFVLVVDGSIPTKDDGIYCMVAGKTLLATVKEAAEGAAGLSGLAFSKRDCGGE